MLSIYCQMPDIRLTARGLYVSPPILKCINKLFEIEQKSYKLPPCQKREMAEGKVAFDALEVFAKASACGGSARKHDRARAILVLLALIGYFVDVATDVAVLYPYLVALPDSCFSADGTPIPTGLCDVTRTYSCQPLVTPPGDGGNVSTLIPPSDEVAFLLGAIGEAPGVPLTEELSVFNKTSISFSPVTYGPVLESSAEQPNFDFVILDINLSIADSIGFFGDDRSTETCIGRCPYFVGGRCQVIGSRVVDNRCSSTAFNDTVDSAYYCSTSQYEVGAVLTIIFLICFTYVAVLAVFGFATKRYGLTAFQYLAELSYISTTLSSRCSDTRYPSDIGEYKRQAFENSVGTMWVVTGCATLAEILLDVVALLAIGFYPEDPGDLAGKLLLSVIVFEPAPISTEEVIEAVAVVSSIVTIGILLASTIYRTRSQDACTQNVMKFVILGALFSGLPYLAFIVLSDTPGAFEICIATWGVFMLILIGIHCSQLTWCDKNVRTTVKAEKG